ncbi:DUF4326 domain-containing protein [Paracoccus sp. IB05]|uniref:DUF4326 domain-containing protein n=1 Tax=Paracoccus sp. IB05 TaxID=2779367 RepID=UPI0018E8C771|nr:DUF4326 domain-containing protein [Paracoccus sp. IB05]MBJ2150664.1 DUF4326 domain-containing protein [Paracoccus sp. IB05]
MRDHAPSSRVQLSRSKGSRLPANTVRCDRSTLFGNPWVPGEDGGLRIPNGSLQGKMDWYPLIPMSEILTPERVVALHAEWLRTGIPSLPAGLSGTDVTRCIDALDELRAAVLGRLPALRGHSFACWCKPGQPCHAETLMEVANV